MKGGVVPLDHELGVALALHGLPTVRPRAPSSAAPSSRARSRSGSSDGCASRSPDSTREEEAVTDPERAAAAGGAGWGSGGGLSRGGAVPVAVLAAVQSAALACVLAVLLGPDPLPPPARGLLAAACAAMLLAVAAAAAALHLLAVRPLRRLLAAAARPRPRPGAPPRPPRRHRPPPVAGAGGAGRGGASGAWLRDEVAELRGAWEAAGAALAAWREHFDALFAFQARPPRHHPPRPAPPSPPRPAPPRRPGSRGRAAQGAAYLCVTEAGAVTRMNDVARKLFGVPEAPPRRADHDLEGGGGRPRRRRRRRAVEMDSVCRRADGTTFLAEMRACRLPTDAATGDALGPATGAGGGSGVARRGSGSRGLLLLQLREAGWKGADPRVSVFMEQANDAVIVMTANSTITAFNRSAQAMFGWTAEEAIGSKVEMLMSKLYGSIHHKAVKRYLQTGEARVVGRLRETTAVRRDGSPFPIELSVAEARVGGERLFVGSIRDASERRRAVQELEDTKSRYQSLLLNILPAPVVKELLEERPVLELATRYEEVAIVFADIVGFTTISEGLDPRVLVQTLNDIFSRFDAICERHGLEKIKTIGDAYMAVSGLPFPIPQHVEAAADTALEMIEALENVPPFTVRLKTRRRAPRPGPGAAATLLPPPPEPPARRGSLELEANAGGVVYDEVRGFSRRPSAVGPPGLPQAAPSQSRATSPASRPTPDTAPPTASAAGAGAEEWEEVEEEQRVDLQIRVGMHMGPVVAGVIGIRKLVYDVWSDAVNVASRMESSGAPGRVHVSAAVEARLRERFELEPRGSVHVKGKGPMETFFLVGRRPEDPGDPATQRENTSGRLRAALSPPLASLPLSNPRASLASEGEGPASAEFSLGAAAAPARSAQSASVRRAKSVHLIRMQEAEMARQEMEDREPVSALAGGFAWERVADPAFNARDVVHLAASEARALVGKLLRMLGLASLLAGKEAALDALVQELQAAPPRAGSPARGFQGALQAAHQLALLVRGVERLRRHVYPAEILGIFLALLCSNAEAAVGALLQASRLPEGQGPGPAAPPQALERSALARAREWLQQHPLDGKPAAAGPSPVADMRRAGRSIKRRAAASLTIDTNPPAVEAVRGAGVECSPQSDSSPHSAHARFSFRAAPFLQAAAAADRDGLGPPSPSSVAAVGRPGAPAPHFSPLRGPQEAPGGGSASGGLQPSPRSPPSPKGPVEDGFGPASPSGKGGRVAALLLEILEEIDSVDERCANTLCSCLEAVGDRAEAALAWTLLMEETAAEYEALRSGGPDRSWSLSEPARARLCALLFRVASFADCYKFPHVAERAAPAFAYQYFPELAPAGPIEPPEREEGMSDGASSVGNNNATSAQLLEGGFTNLIMGGPAASLGTHGHRRSSIHFQRARSASDLSQSGPSSRLSSLGLATISSSLRNPLAPAWPAGAAQQAAAVARARRAARLAPAALRAWQASAEHVIAFIDIVVGPVLHVAGRLLEELADEEGKLEQPREMFRAIAFAGPLPPPGVSTPDADARAGGAAAPSSNSEPELATPRSRARARRLPIASRHPASTQAQAASGDSIASPVARPGPQASRRLADRELELEPPRNPFQTPTALAIGHYYAFGI
eukprot:tig00021537_g22324.t1